MALMWKVKDFFCLEAAGLSLVERPPSGHFDQNRIVLSALIDGPAWSVKTLFID